MLQFVLTASVPMALPVQAKQQDGGGVALSKATDLCATGYASDGAGSTLPIGGVALSKATDLCATGYASDGAGSTLPIANVNHCDQLDRHACYGGGHETHTWGRSSMGAAPHRSQHWPGQWHSRAYATSVNVTNRQHPSLHLKTQED